MGGDCLNTGCVPSKAVIRAARAVAAVRDAGRFGVRVPDGVTVDFGQVMERMRRLRADISPHDSARRFRDLGVDVFFGAGCFTSSDTVVVGGQSLRFARAVIATGARPAVPPVPGLAVVPFLTNETVFNLTRLPRRLGLLGAGPIGCELAQAFALLGSEVVLVEGARGLLPREDRDAAAMVRTAMERDGVRVLPGGRALRVAAGAAGGIGLQPGPEAGSGEFVVDQLLVATGRIPNVAGLGLDAAGVAHGPHGVTVDDHLRTTNPRIFACGDVCSPHQFTHAADFMARLVIQNALFPGRARVSSLLIPRCTYPSPELAHVGLGASEARDRGMEVDTFTQELSKVDRAILDGDSSGFVRIHVRRGTDTIVGATVVAPRAGDQIGEITLAMKGGLGLNTVGAAIHPYPTHADAFRRTGDLYRRTRLTPRVKRLMAWWFRWRR